LFVAAWSILVQLEVIGSAAIFRGGFHVAPNLSDGAASLDLNVQHLVAITLVFNLIMLFQAF
jgi:hypothetical protein